MSASDASSAIYANISVNLTPSRDAARNLDENVGFSPFLGVLKARDASAGLYVNVLGTAPGLARAASETVETAVRGAAAGTRSTSEAADSVVVGADADTRIGSEAVETVIVSVPTPTRSVGHALEVLINVGGTEPAPIEPWASPVAQGPVWTLVIGPWTGGPEHELTIWSDLQIAWPLLEGAGLSCTIPGEHPAARFIKRLETDLWAYRNTQLVFRGRITKYDSKIGPDECSVDLGCSDYRRILNRRIIWEAAGRTYSQVDQATIAWDLVDYTQHKAGGNLGITRGLAPTGVKRDRQYEGGANIGQLLDDLSQVENGFDYDVDVNRKFNVYYPQRGTLQDMVFDYGGIISEVNRTIDTEAFVNAVRVSGDDTVGYAQAFADNIDNPPVGRWEEQLGYPDVNQFPTLLSKAKEVIKRSAHFVSAWDLTLCMGTWADQLIPIEPGDTIRLDVHEACEDVSTTARISEISIHAGADGDETIELAAVDT